jgi:hypothetical protein
MYVEDVSFSNVAVAMALDAEAGDPAMAPDMEPMQRAGFFACNARGLRFNDVEVTDHLGPALILTDVEDVEISRFTTHTPNDSPVIQMKNVDDAFVHGCRAMPGTVNFIHIEGSDTQNIVINGNNLSRADERINLAKDLPPDALVE